MARAEAVRAAVAELREREREIVESHFGLEGDPHTLEQIAHDLHLAPERVRQIERHAFATLARRLAAPGTSLLAQASKYARGGFQPPQKPPKGRAVGGN